MAEGMIRKTSPRGLVRLLVRLPIWLYRHGFGWLFGNRLLMLKHIGRKTGLPRYVVLEVVHHDRASDTYFVASGWRSHADWLRNVQQNPRVEVYSGRQQIMALAEQLSPDQAANIVYDYAAHHRIAFRFLAKFMVGEFLTATRHNCQRLAQVLPVVALRPRIRGR